MSVEGILAKIQHRQFRVSTLYQQLSGWWYCVLTISGMWDYAYGSGETAEEALVTAYADAKRRKGEGLARVLAAKTKKEKMEALSPLAQLRKHLGLKKRKRLRL